MSQSNKSCFNLVLNKSESTHHAAKIELKIEVVKGAIIIETFLDKKSVGKHQGTHIFYPCGLPFGARIESSNQDKLVRLTRLKTDQKGNEAVINQEEQVVKKGESVKVEIFLAAANELTSVLFPSGDG